MSTIAEQMQEMTSKVRENLQWVQLLGGEEFDYPIDYSVAVLSADIETGQAEFVVRWAPNAYCHFHRHTGQTSTLVLEGEHHVIDESPTETLHSIRKPGHMSSKPAGDLHMERGGPEGSTVLFRMQSPDGVLFEFVGRDGTLLRTITVADLATGNV